MRCWRLCKASDHQTLWSLNPFYLREQNLTSIVSFPEAPVRFSLNPQDEDTAMTFLKTAAAAALLTFLPVKAMAAETPTTEQCSTWFERVDSNKDGALGQQEDASKYAGMVSKSSVADKNSSTSADALIIQKDVFMKYCGEGTFGMPMN
jgi:hypothetical protein